MDSTEAKYDPIVMLENDYHFFNIEKDLETSPSNLMQKVNDKLIETTESEPFKFKTLILKLILAHEYAHIKNYKDSLDTLEELESGINTLEEINCDMIIFKKVSVAIHMMLRTCMAYVLISQYEEKKAKEIVSLITPIENLDTVQKASVYGIRSMVYMEYGFYGHKMALENAGKANKIDPKNAYWYFLIGKSLGRIRRIEKCVDIPSDEERNALKTAIEMEEHYLFLLYLADSYVETASKTYRFHVRNRSLYPILKLSINQMNEEASNIFKKCIEKEPNCSHVLFRAARGFLNLPNPQRDVERAKELLFKGLKSNSRNAFANHLLARYYERFDNNVAKAIKHLKICTNQRVFGAEMDLLRLEFRKDKLMANPIEKLKRMLGLYAEVPRKIQILTQMASFYVFVDLNLPKACQLIKDAITLSCDHNILEHRSIFIPVPNPFSLLDVLVDEIKMKMELGCSKEDEKVYESFIIYLNESNLPFIKGRGKNLRDCILKEGEETRLDNRYRRPTYANGPLQMRRRQYAKPIPKSALEHNIVKAPSVQRVEEYFDSRIGDMKGNKNEQNRFSKTNSSNSSSNDLNSDHSPVSDCRFSKSCGWRNRNRNSRNYIDDDIQFDRLGLHNQPTYSRNKQCKSDDFKPSEKNDDVVEEINRLSISSNRSGISKACGESSYSNPRPSEARNDSDQSSRGKERARLSNSINNRSNSNDLDASRFPSGQDQVLRRPVEKADHEYANTLKQGRAPHVDRKNINSTRNEQNSDTSPSSYKSKRDEFISYTSRAKTTNQPESIRNSEHKTIAAERDDQNSEKSTLFKNWRIEHRNRSFDEIEDQQRSEIEKKKTYSDIDFKPLTKNIQSNDNDDSDSDDDIMSYFKKI